MAARDESEHISHSTE